MKSKSDNTKKKKRFSFVKPFLFIFLFLILFIFIFTNSSSTIQTFPKFLEGKLLPAGELNSVSNSGTVNFPSNIRYTGNYKVIKTGNESKLDVEIIKNYDLNNSYSNTTIKIIADQEEYNIAEVDEKTQKEIVKGTWTPPENLSVYKNKEVLSSKILSRELKKEVDEKEKEPTSIETFEEGDKYEYEITLNPISNINERHVKIGDNSIIVIAETEVYSSASTNQVQVETNFSHLELEDSSIVGYWNFDKDDNTTAYDWTDNNNDGIYQGDAYSGAGLYSNSLFLDGTGDYISISDDDSFDFTNTTDFTLSAWVKANSVKTTGIIMKGNSSDRYSLVTREQFLGNTYWEFEIESSGVTEDIETVYTAGSWTYLVGTYNSADGNMSLYVNGDIAVSSLSSLGDFSNSEPLEIGQFQYNDPFNGEIDEVMIFNRTLNSTEIQDIYNNQSSRFYSTGSFEPPQQNITVGDNRINVTTTFESELGSGVNLSVGEWEISKGYNDTFSSNENDLNYGLVGYWHLDNNSAYGENDTHVFDYSGQGNNGSVINAIPTSSGVYGGAFEFDGDGDYLNVGDVSFLDGPQTSLSVFAWVKLNTYNNYVGIVTKGETMPGGDDWMLYTDNDGSSWNVYFNGTTAASSNSLNVGEWNLVGFSWDSTIGKVNLYHNSILQDNFIEGITSFSSSSNAEVMIGRTYDNFDGLFFNGSIDDVMIFNRSLSADEIKELYVKGRANFDYSEPQELTTGTAETFTIDTTTTNIHLNYTQIAGTDNFYSPIQYGDISYETYLIADDLQINFTNPTPANDSYDEGSFIINVSVTEESLDNIVFNWNGTNETEVSINDLELNANLSMSGLTSFNFSNGTDSIDLQSDLILHYSFDNISALGENSTYVVDTSDTGNNGDIVGDGDEINNTNKKYGYSSIDFDGSNDYLDVGEFDSIDGATAVTFSFWINPDSLSGTDSPIRKWTAGAQSFLFEGNMMFRVNDGSNYDEIQWNTEIPNNEWHHVVVTWSTGSAPTAYYDGVNDSTSPSHNGCTSVLDTTEHLSLGARYNGGSPDLHYNGRLDEVRVYTRELTPTEVNQLYYMNLRKFDTERWNLYINQSTSGNWSINSAGTKSVDVIKNNASSYNFLRETTSEDEGTYTYQAFAEDTSSNTASTEERTINIETPSISISRITPSLTNGNYNATQNQFFQVDLNVTCDSSNTDCGNINVSLDPISGCEPDNEDCTATCDGIFINDTTEGTWGYDPYSFEDSCYEDFNTIYYVSSTDYCNTVLSESKSGDCARFDDPMFNYGGDSYWCPSYDRNGGAVSSSDCTCTVLMGDCSSPPDYTLIFDFTNEFFAGESAGGGKGGLINTTAGATPFYTSKSSNPYTINLNASQSQTVTFQVNATGDYQNSTYNATYEFFAYANLTSDLSIGNITDYWNVTIVNGTGGGVADTSFTVSLPTGYDTLNFTANKKTINYVNASGQDKDNPALEITNTGDVNLNISLLLNQTITGFTLVRSLDNKTANAKDINTTNFLLKQDLTPASSQDVWIWLSWINQNPNTIPSKLNVSVVEN